MCCLLCGSLFGYSLFPASLGFTASVFIHVVHVLGSRALFMPLSCKCHGSNIGPTDHRDRASHNRPARHRLAEDR